MNNFKIHKFIIIIISSVILFSCNNQNSINEKIENKKEFNKQEVIEHFFDYVKIWNEDSIVSLANQITKTDSTLFFYHTDNQYDKGSFIFNTGVQENFYDFKNSSFLANSTFSQSTSYTHWRKTIENKNILDISIEPHPTLKWILVIRKRSQE